MRDDSFEIATSDHAALTRRRLAAHLAAAPLLVAIGLLDWTTGTEISISIFYLLPVTLLAWYGNAWGVIATSVVSAAAWVWAEVAAGASYGNAAIPYWNGAVRFGFFVLFGLAALRVRTLQSRERVLARTDPLTGLFNRRAFFEILAAEVARARRHRHPFTLIFVDLDGFKQINDQRGHAAGDLVFQAVGTALRSYMRASDYCARLGGDEFAVLLAETADNQAAAGAERLRAVLERVFRDGGWRLSASIGALACSTFDDTTPDQLLHAADQLMYAAKARGGGHVQCASFESIADSWDS